MGRIRGLLLDVDGTLCNTDDVHFEVYREMLSALGFNGGLPITRAYFDTEISGGANELILQRIVPEFSAEQRVAFALEKETRWRRQVQGALAPIAGLHDFAHWADSERQLMRCAVTNAPRLNAEAILTGIALLDWFTPANLVIGEECPRAKPFPDPYLIGAQRLGLEPHECLVVEDSAAGLAAAVAARVGCIVGISTSISAEALRKHGAQHVIQDWSDATIFNLLS
ncbi:Haloacid dehalogenase-like hydrolase domain-containing protein Sgpp [Porphyridium purpureum]|uniref:Haloacid dehalogenase-like hydrolase domain-containing protein Sgpp n=1 Tax=Porphyridium purpureum TaxID=35688 RepID=A0A5J4YPQ8_PORPP|nr:Haloacid dehalogenase-like hydrolase domain-containing protein Sgpp [Porphyridium purpureum]|eukprot:POR2640..scf296_7